MNSETKKTNSSSELFYAFITHTFNPQLYRVINPNDIGGFVSYLRHWKKKEVEVLYLDVSRFDEKDATDVLTDLTRFHNLAFVIYDPKQEALTNLDGISKYFRDI